MNRRTTLALATVLVVAAVVAPFGAAAAISSTGSQSGADTDADHARASAAEDESIAPGEHLAGVVGTQHAEIDGEVSERAYGVRIANANSDEARAEIVDEHVAANEQRLEELETRLEALNESREAGEISEGRYRAEVATVTAEMRAIERQLGAAERTAAELPASALADRGIDVESIRTLRDRAGERGGPETAAIAREIAGPDERGLGPGPDSGAPIGADRSDGERDDGNGGDETDGDGTDSDDTDGDASDDGESTAS